MKKQHGYLLLALVGVTSVSILGVLMLNFYVDPYIGVDEVVENSELYLGRTVQVKGNLLAGSLSVTSENVTLIMYGDSYSILVLVAGDLPDVADDQELVAIGTVESSLLIIAATLLAQCPSKYETNTTVTTP